MARNRRLKKQDGDAYYHVMSRTSGSRFLFAKGRMKRRIAELLARSAEFSGVELKAYCIMDNHFHAVCKVAKPDGPVPEEEVVRRIGVLKGEAFAAELATRWAEQREGGLGCLVDAAVNAWRGRMNDLSQFAKTFKELVNIAFKTMPEGDPGYSGGLWGGRFKSTLVEGGWHLAVCVRYVELNPVRAGIVARARDYAYRSGDSSEAPAGVAGSPLGFLLPQSAGERGRVPSIPNLRASAPLRDARQFTPTADATGRVPPQIWNLCPAYDFLAPHTGGFELGIELVVKARALGRKIVEVPTTWRDRVAGKSNFKLWQWLPNYLRWFFYAFGCSHGSRKVG